MGAGPVTPHSGVGFTTRSALFVTVPHPPLASTLYVATSPACTLVICSVLVAPIVVIVIFPPLAKVTTPFFHTKLNGLTPLAVVLNTAVVPAQFVELFNGVAVVPVRTVSVAGEITVPQAPVTSTLYP